MFPVLCFLFKTIKHSRCHIINPTIIFKEYSKPIKVFPILQNVLNHSTRCLINPTRIFKSILIPSIATIFASIQPKIRSAEIADLAVEDNISHLITLARIALEKGEADRAQAILEMGVKICEDHKSYTALPYLYDILATISFAMGDYAQTEALLVDIIEKMLQIEFDDSNSHIIDFKLRLARIYSLTNEPQLAEIGFKTCMDQELLKIQKGDSSNSSGILYVNTLFWYGMHKIKMEEFRSAKELIHCAYDYSMKIKGLNSYQEMMILYTLAELNMELSEYHLALQNMQSAILLGKGTGSSDLPRCYIKLAKIYVKLGALESAKASADEGLKLSTLFKEKFDEEDAKDVLRTIETEKKKIRK